MTDNLTAFLLVVSIICGVLSAVGAIAHICALVEYKTRKRGATRIAKWSDNRSHELRSRAVKLMWSRVILRFPSHARIPHLAHDRNFIPQWMRLPTEVCDIAIMRKQAD